MIICLPDFVLKCNSNFKYTYDNRNTNLSGTLIMNLVKKNFTLVQEFIINQGKWYQ